MKLHDIVYFFCSLWFSDAVRVRRDAVRTELTIGQHHYHLLNKEAIPVPKACTWNSGGGAPQPEFIGGDWMKQEGEVGNFWDKAEQWIGSVVMVLADPNFDSTAAVPGYDYSRYSIKNAGLEDSSTKTVGQLLKGLETFAAGKELDLSKWKCWKGLTLQKVMQHALGVGGTKPLFEESGCDEKWAGARTTFAAPDGCFKHRLSKFAIGPSFVKLLDATDDATFWDIWYTGMTNAKWGPSKFCESSKHGSIERAMTTEQQKHEADWIAMAVWDRFVVSITKGYFRSLPDSGLSLKLTDLTTVDQMDEQDVSEDILKKIKHLATTNDVIMLQEGPDPKDEKNLETEFAPPEKNWYPENNWYISGVDAVVMVKPKSKDWPGVDQHATGIAEKALNEEKENMMKNKWTPMSKKKEYERKKAVGEANTFWSSTKYMAVAVANDIVFVSVHSDSDGFYCSDALEVAQKTIELTSKRHGKKLAGLVGMDSNVLAYPNPEKLEQGIESLLERAKTLGMEPIYPPNDSDGYQKTVWKMRSFVQAQLHKAGKVDKTTKDWLFWYPGEAGVKSVHGEAKVFNQIDESYIEEMFPKESWVADHFVVQTPRQS